MSDKVFKVRGRDGFKYSDEEVILMIKNGDIKPNDYIATNEMGMWIRVSDSIYQFYINKELRK